MRLFLVHLFILVCIHAAGGKNAFAQVADGKSCADAVAHQPTRSGFRFTSRSILGLTTLVAALSGARVFVDAERQRDDSATRYMDFSLQNKRQSLDEGDINWPLAGRAFRMEQSHWINPKDHKIVIYTLGHGPLFWRGWDMGAMLSKIDKVRDGKVAECLSRHGIDPVLMRDSGRWNEFGDRYSHMGLRSRASLSASSMVRVAQLDAALGDLLRDYYGDPVVQSQIASGQLTTIDDLIDVVEHDGEVD